VTGARPSITMLVNPTAGKGRSANLVAAVAGRLREEGSEVRIVMGRDADEANQLAVAAVADGTDALVALGGDGLVNLALNAVAGTHTPLGIVPAGTGNDLANSLGLPVKDPLASAAVVAQRLADDGGWPMDAVRVGDRWFGCVLGAGFDSRVNDRANRLSWPRGPMRYNVAMLAELGVFHPVPFTLTIDDHEPFETEAMLVAVGNARSYGAGMKVCPDASLNDGLIDVTVIGKVSKLEFLKTFPKVFKGTHVDHPAVSTYRANVVTIAAPGTTAYADGEFMADLPVTCVCVPGAVRILA
jgi:diacylglycerol kinase (ATP)